MYVYTTFSLSIHPSKDIWVVFIELFIQSCSMSACIMWGVKKRSILSDLESSSVQEAGKQDISKTPVQPLRAAIIEIEWPGCTEWHFINNSTFSNYWPLSSSNYYHTTAERRGLKVKGKPGLCVLWGWGITGSPRGCPGCSRLPCGCLCWSPGFLLTQPSHPDSPW